MCKLAVTHSILTCSSLYDLQHFSLRFVIIFRMIQYYQASAPEKVPRRSIGAESNRTTGRWRNAPNGKTQQQCTLHLVQRDTGIVATKNVTQNAHLKMVRKAGKSKNNKQHLIKGGSFNIIADNGQLRIYNTQLGCVDSYMTNLSLPVTSKLHGRPRHLSTQSQKLNIKILWVRGFSHMNFVIYVPRNGQNRSYSP